MILKIDGLLKPYYAQTLAMIFFPGAKFPENEEKTPETVEASIRLTEDEAGVSATVTLTEGEKTSSGFHTAAWNDSRFDRDRQRQIAAGEAFMEAGTAFTGLTPPWGILTGVRPAKVAMELLEAGMTPAEAAAEIENAYHVTPVKARLAADVAAAEKRLITPESRRLCSVYIGIPFCPTRCAYCSFVSYTSPGLLKLIPDYLTALLSDIDGIFSVIREHGMKVASVYIGGGTPTILTAEQMTRLLDKVNENVTELEEFTVEAGRPDTITKEKLDVFRAHGVSRMSVNPQSLNEEVLRKIGRSHTTEQFYRAYELARESGIRDINVDLIAGLPYDTTESFCRTVDGVVALDPENITVHTFSVKRSSEFKAEGRFDPASEIAAESVRYSQTALGEAGYLPYYMYRQKNTVGNLENVGYAKKGHEGLYNIYMMEEVHSIFAAGAGSVTKLVSEPAADGSVRIERVFQPKYPYEYLSGEEKAAEKLKALRTAARDFFAPHYEEPNERN